jgi:hypothetical protein
MTDEPGTIGVATNPLQTMPPEEQQTLAKAVRESIRRSVLEMLERKGVVKADLVQCPECGERVIFLDQPATFSYDRGEDRNICAACGAERDFIMMHRPQTDIGGEGGG